MRLTYTQAEALGIPAALFFLQEAIYRGLPHQEAEEFQEQFLDAIQGVNLSLLIHRFLYWLRMDEQYGIVHNTYAPHQWWYIQRVARLHKRVIILEQGTQSEWVDPEIAAYSTSGSASVAATISVNTHAASGAAYSMASFAILKDPTLEHREAKRQHYRVMSDQLLTLLMNARR